ncbi:DUF5069 domain-containing protein [Haloferula sargassicola]
MSFPTLIPGLRGPSEKVAGLVYFGRMVDKVRLAAEGKLPEAWEASRGTAYPNAFDNRCCRFLGIDYAAFEKRVREGGRDEDLLEWAFEHGRRPGDEEIEIWNAFMTKLGWRDVYTERVDIRLGEIGLPAGTVATMFEFIDLDEGRLPLPTA